MKKSLFVFLVLAMIGTALFAYAAAKEKTALRPSAQRELIQRFGFVDENGDGINDLSRDADGDGIPNGLDPDWVRPLDGSGYKNKYGYRQQLNLHGNHGQADRFNHRFNYMWRNRSADPIGTPVCDNTGSNGRMGRNRRITQP